MRVPAEKNHRKTLLHGSDFELFYLPLTRRERRKGKEDGNYYIIEHYMGTTRRTRSFIPCKPRLSLR